MDKLVIEGGRPLRGTLTVSGSKNTALPLMAAALLADGTTTIDNVPNLRDVNTFSDVLRVSGAEVEFDADAHVMTIDASTIDTPVAPYELVKKMRASFYMLGALLGRCGKGRVSLPGGCAWGPRPVNLHLEGMRAFGAEIELDEGYVVAHAPGGRLPGGTFTLEPSSVGATINLALAASTAQGTSRIENAAIEPDVVVFLEALQRMGAQIDGIGTRTVEIEGVDGLQPIAVTNCPDRIELGTFMIAAAIAGEPNDTIRIENANPDHLGRAFLDKFAATGTHFVTGADHVEVSAPDVLEPVSIETAVFPGFPTDLQAQWSVLLSQSPGAATITDTIYDDRFSHIPELARMGLQASVDGNTVTVEGHTHLKGATVMSTDLRASVSLVLAGMVAEGQTDVLRVYHLDRGYERLEVKLQNAGIQIHREQYDEFATPDVLKDD
ncbi:MAG: UDP-N-acetylglucosamine 1-carboxyvinyltransferase [Bacteroidetes bacterium]|jgi:UDP-N-acetylglucosamine 1-carboxyvinyltransferase|nr:UDP-N-acetylglucosamine 1-carboxyvinyltransferase [Bacteroidota bacterium]